MANQLAHAGNTDDLEMTHALGATSERGFRLLAEAGQDVIFRYRLSPTHGHEYISPSVAVLIGYTPEEFYADPDLILKIVHPADRPLLDRLGRNPAARTVSVVLRWIRKDGAVCWTEQRSVPLRDAAGHLVAIEGVARDVTERKHLEDTLRASEQRFRLLAEQARDVIFRYRVSPTPGPEYISPAVTSLTGYTPEEFYADPELPARIIHPDDRALHDSLVQDPVPAARLPVVLRWIRKNGTIVWTEHRYTAVADNTGSIVAIEGIARDVTERKLAEEALRASEERYRNIYSTAPLAFVLWDERARVIDWNQRAEELFGWSRAEALGRNFLEFLIPAPARPGVHAAVEQLLKGRLPISSVNENLTKSGKIVVCEWNTSPLHGGQGQVVGGMSLALDITERRRAEAAVHARARQQAAVTLLGQHALAHTDLSALLQEAVAIVARTLDVEYCKVLELLPDGSAFLLRAGVGWKAGAVGHATVGSGTDSQAGYTLRSREAIVVDDLRTETRFAGPPLLHDHGVVSGVSVIIHGQDYPFGVLGAHASRRRTFDRNDVHFLGAVANVLAAAIERQQAEAALRASEIRYRELFENANDIIYTHDLSGRFTSINNIAECVTGYGRDQVVTMNITQVVAPEDGDRIRKMIDRVVAGEEPPVCEFEIIAKDGRRVPLEVSLRLLFEGVTPVGIQGIGRDISERRRAALLLTGEKRILEMVATTAPLPTVLAALCRLVEEQAPHLRCSILLLDDAGRLRHGAAPSLAESYTGAIDGLAIGPRAGSCGTAAYRGAPVIVADIATDPLWTDFRDLALQHGLRACWSTPMVAPNGAVLGTLATYDTQPGAPTVDELRLIDRASDLASIAVQRHRAEAGLRRYAARLKILHEIDQTLLAAPTASAIGETVLGHVRQLLPCQRADVVLFNGEGDDTSLLATHVDPGAHTGRQRPAFAASVIAELRQGKVCVVEDVLSHPEPLPLADVWSREGVRSAMIVPLLARDELIGALNLSADQPRTFTNEQTAIGREVADLLAIGIQQACLREQVERHAAELEHRVKARTQQLEAANQELEAFSYSVSHDLRAPLRAIDGFSALLLEDHASTLDAEGHHYLERIRCGAAHMTELIEDLLGLSRVVRSEMQWGPVDLSALVDRIASELRNTHPERDVTFVIAPGVVAPGDAHLLGLALENLFGNAWKYTRKHPQARIEFGVTGLNGERIYFVRDDGAGFDMAYASKLFGPFQRLHGRHEFEGTGIGLATVQRIIHRHGGRVWAEGAIEQGATFYFTLQRSGEGSYDA